MIITPMIITDERVQAAVDYLEDSAVDAAQAQADLDHLKHYRSALEAILMKEADDGDTSAAIQKRDAHARLDYATHLEALKDATFRAVKFQYLREAKQAVISVWQSDNKRRSF